MNTIFSFYLGQTKKSKNVALFGQWLSVQGRGAVLRSIRLTDKSKDTVVLKYTIPTSQGWIDYVVGQATGNATATLTCVMVGIPLHSPSYGFCLHFGFQFCPIYNSLLK